MVDPSMVVRSDMRRLELETVSAEEGESAKLPSMECVFKRCFSNFLQDVSIVNTFWGFSETERRMQLATAHPSRANPWYRLLF